MNYGISLKKLVPISRVAIIILNWNGWKETVECLESIFQINYPYYDVILIDNGSKDDSIQMIRTFGEGIKQVNSEFNISSSDNKPINFSEFSNEELETRNDILNTFKQSNSQKRLVLIKNEQNYGFAEGNNIGIRFALKYIHPGYILLLNNDTIVEENFLTELVLVADAHPDTASVQSLLLRPGGHIIDSLGQELRGMVPWDRGMGIPINNFEFNDIQEIFGTCAAAALYRAEVFEKVGFFDRDFFLIYEDVDFSWRIRLHGFKALLVTKSIVYHKRGISGGGISKRRMVSEIKWYQSKNLILLVIRYIPVSKIVRTIIAWPQKIVVPIFFILLIGLRKDFLKQFAKEVRESLRIRNEIKSNQLLKNIQKKWIK